MTLETFLNSVGWFDSATQTEPSHDMTEGRDDAGLCMLCTEPIPLDTPMKSIAMRYGSKFVRSYFFRVHTACFAGALPNAADEIAWKAIDTFHMETV